MKTDDLIKICAEQGIQFVNRSYGKVTTTTVTLDALEKIVAQAEQAAVAGFHLSKITVDNT